MASSPISSCQTEEGKVETVPDFIFLGCKITMDNDFSHEIKRRLLLGRKAMTNLDSVLKSRDTVLLTKVHTVKAMLFPVVMYGCESWTRKKAEPKNWCIQIVVLEKTLESPLDSKESKPVNPKGNQPWIFIGRTAVEVEARIIWPPDAKSQLTGKDPCWKRLRAGGEVGKRGWDGWMASLPQNMSLSKCQEIVKYRKAWHTAWATAWGRKESDRT